MSETYETRDFEKKMISSLYRFDCPDPFELGDFHFGLLPEEGIKEITEHLKVCPYCREELIDLKEFLKGDPVPAEFKLNSLKDLKKIIPFGRNEVHYETSEIKTAVRSEAVKEHKKVRIKYSDTESVELFYNIVLKDMFYVIKGQFVMNEFLEEVFIDSLIEIWQDNKIKTVVKIDKLCSFRCVIKELKPVIIRISNQTGTILSFHLNIAK